MLYGRYVGCRILHMGCYSLYVDCCSIHFGRNRRHMGCYILYECCEGFMQAVSSSMHAVHALCGLLLTLCGLLNPLRGLLQPAYMLHVRYVGCHYQLQGTKTGNEAIAFCGGYRAFTNIPRTCPSVTTRVHVGLRFDPRWSRPTTSARNEDRERMQRTKIGNADMEPRQGMKMGNQDQERRTINENAQLNKQQR